MSTVSIIFIIEFNKIDFGKIVEVPFKKAFCNVKIRLHGFCLSIIY